MTAFSNYNSVLIGSRAAGMGGAYTALSDDPAACSFYNPAALARMEGASLSATANVYAKYDTGFGEGSSLSDGAAQVNQGSIVPIPASSGSIYSFRNFSVGLSIIFPDFEQYNGEVLSTETDTSTLNLRDQSLWVGGTVALNLNEEDAIGLTMYYTSRTYTRSLNDQSVSGGETTSTNEETSFTNNSIIYTLGWWRELGSNWSTGLSYRFPSLEVSGRGSYYRNEISTAGTSSVIRERETSSDSKIPEKVAWGIAYTQDKRYTLSMDVNYYGKESYRTLEDVSDSDYIEHQAIWNLSLGSEYYWKSWLALRFGLYSNLSSHPELKSNVSYRQGDHIDMWGFSANAAIFTTEHSTITLGGYYSGGKGHSSQRVGQQIRILPKSLQVFSFLVGTAFNF